MIYVLPCIACRMANAIPAAIPFIDEDDEEDEDRLTPGPRPGMGRKIA
jgi:hypothetical protein